MRYQIVLALVLLWGLWLWLGASRDPLSIQAVRVNHQQGQAIAARLYQPVNVSAPYPAVLLCHGVNSSKDTLAPLAQALAYHGIAAIVFDFGGYGESYRRANSQAANQLDAAAMLQWMRQQPQLDAQRLGIIGHSMGGTTALELAQAAPDVKATVVLSIAGFATPRSPNNLFLGSGIYEELNPVSTMQALYEDAVAGDAPPFAVIGRFADGTARQLFFSPTVDHALAPYDAILHAAVIRWVEQSLGGLPQPSTWNAQRLIMGSVLSGIGGIGWGVVLYRGLSLWPKRWVSGGLAAIAVGLLIGGFQAFVAGFWLCGLMMVGLGNYRDRLRQPSATCRRCLLYGLLLFSLLLLAIGVNAIATGSLIAMPSALLGLPVLAQTMLLGLPYDRFHLLRYALTTTPGGMVAIALITSEMYRPGILLHRLGQWLGGAIALVQQPWDCHWRGFSWPQLGMALLLLGVLAIILIQQSRRGLLTWEAGSFALRLIGIFVVLPSLVGIGVVRSRRFQRLESRLADPKFRTP